MWQITAIALRAIALRASKLVLKPHLNIFFISNHANETGGAIHITDYQCSLGSSIPVECFITVDGPSTSTSNISLYFVNNSAGTSGSILHGGQLDQCRLYFKSITTDEELDLCDRQAHSYSDNVLKMFINMSNITQNEVLDISSAAKEIKPCKGKTPEQLVLYPGQQFTIPLIALGQTNSPVPTTVFWEKMYPLQHGEYRLSPSSGKITDSCTNVSFWLFSSDLESHYFKLYPQNLCQNLAKGLTMSIYVLPCPIGFDLSRKNSKCVCAAALKKLRVQNCYIDSKSGSVERIKNNFWIFALAAF